MIRIQIREGILKPLLLQKFFLTTRGNQKFREIDQPRPICIDNLEDLIDIILADIFIVMLFEYGDELGFADYAVAVFVDLTEIL